MGDTLSELFDDAKFGSSADLATAASQQEDLFSILESLGKSSSSPLDEVVFGCTPTPTSRAVEESRRKASLDRQQAREQEYSESSTFSPSPKKMRLSPSGVCAAASAPAIDGQHRMSHIAVERNRRKQMNEHLTVVRSMMPSFYVKRGDQASIIGGVVDYIEELRQVLKSLEAKKQRKAYSEVLSPRTVTSPRPPPLSPRPSPLSPRIGLPISPRTPTPGSPYKPTRSVMKMQHQQQQQCYGLLLSPTSQMVPSLESSPSFDSAPHPTTAAITNVDHLPLVANSKSAVADVEVKFSGPNVLVKTTSHKIPGQAVKIVAALEGLALEILHVSISTIDDTMLNSFTIKIGIECELSAEELAQEIQQTFA